MIPITTAITGIAVESIPKPIPEIMTVAGPVFPLSTQLLGRTVGLGSIVLRRPPDDDTYYQTHYHGAGNPQPVVQLQATTG